VQNHLRNIKAAIRAEKVKAGEVVTDTEDSQQGTGKIINALKTNRTLLDESTFFWIVFWALKTIKLRVLFQRDTNNCKEATILPVRDVSSQVAIFRHEAGTVIIPERPFFARAEPHVAPTLV